jgi:hypothetical protein
MTTPAEAAPLSDESEPRHALRSAMMAERRAYEVMRALVPDLALPQHRRRPLTERQRAAIEDYSALRDRLEILRSQHRSPGLSLVPDQSV